MLGKMIDYQREETNLVRLENELSKSTAREKVTKIQQILKNQHSELVTLENSAKKANELYSKAIQKYEEYMKKLEKLEEEIQNADPEKSAMYEKVYRDFVNVGASLEKDVTSVYNEVKRISDSYEEIIKKSKTYRDEFDKNMVVYKKLKAETDPKIEDAKSKMEAFEKAIDSKIFMVYKQKRDSHIFPVFVELINNKCGGCRMDISASKLIQMKTNDLGIIECENCGRFIYQE